MHFGQHSAASGGLAYSSVSPGAYYRPTYTASNWSGLGSDSRYGIGSRNFSYKPEDRWKNYTPTPAPENGLFHSREDVKSYLAGPRRMENTSGASHLHQSATYQTHRKERLTTDISRPVHSNYISQSILKASVANPPTASETVLHRARESSLQTQPKKSGNDFQGSSSFAGNPSGQPSYGEGHFSRYDSQPSLVNGRSTGYSASDQKAPIRLATEKSSTERMSHHRLDKPPVSNSISQNQSASRAPVPVSKMASNSASGKSVDYQVTCSNERSGGAVEAFGICTTQGIIKTVNEDGVSVIMNVNSPDTSHKYSYFAVFDGHGGHQCVNYLKDQLHLKVLNDPAFPNSIDKAIFNGVIKAEKEFLGVQPSDKSGACCLIIIFKGKRVSHADNDCYIGNVGDCRAVMSSHHGKRDIQITIDHKPESELETERIKKAGGYIYK